VRVATGVEETNLGTGAGQCAVREEERRVAGRSCHGAVIGVGKDGTGVWIVGLRQATEEETLGIDRRYVRRRGIGDGVTTHGLKEREGGDWQATRPNVSVNEAELKVVVGLREGSTQGIELISVRGVVVIDIIRLGGATVGVRG
jgi:hypothetical protein